MRLLGRLIVVSVVVLAANRAIAETADEALLAGAAQRSPAVATILESPRQTPAAQLSAVLTLVDLGEAEVAAVIWKSLAAMKLKDSVCADLAAKFGTARLLKLARLEKQGEVSANFAGAKSLVSRCIQAASQRARDPQRLAKLIADLNSTAAEARKAARVDLAATGVDGAKACLEALAQAKDESARANLMLALTDLHPAVDPLLVTALIDGHGHFRRDVAELCGYLQVRNAVPWLAAVTAGAGNDPAMVTSANLALKKMRLSIPGIADARAMFRREIEQLEHGAAPDWQPAADSYQWWTFDSTTGKFSTRKVSPNQRQIMTITKLARSLSQLPGANEEDRHQALIYAYQESQQLGMEPTAEIQQLARSMGSAQLSTTLTKALRKDHVAAAIACTNLLGRLATTEPWKPGDQRPAALAEALGHSSRKLRFVALEAIMKLAPQRSFAGASRVPKALWEFAAGAGPAQAVVASSVISRADDWAAQLREVGYEATPATSGRRALQAAMASTRLELLLIDSDIGKPQLRETVFQLRASQQAARVPVAILSSLPNLARARHLAGEDSKLFAVARPHSEQAMQDIVARLKQLDEDQTTPEQRTARAAQAIGWIAQLLGEGHPYDELLRDAKVLSQTVHVPGLLESSLQALAVVGTARSQVALVDFASDGVHPIEARQLAAKSFVASVERFGKQLRLQEIHRQYDRYNASESSDKETQQVLSWILNALEGKDLRASSP